MCTIISVVLNTIIAASEHCKLPSVTSIFYWFNFFSKAPFTIQNSHVVGFMIGDSRPTTQAVFSNCNLSKMNLFCWVFFYKKCRLITVRWFIYRFQSGCFHRKSLFYWSYLIYLLSYRNLINPTKSILPLGKMDIKEDVTLCPNDSSLSLWCRGHTYVRLFHTANLMVLLHKCWLLP